MAAGPVFLPSFHFIFFSRREMRAPLNDFAQNGKVGKERKKITEIFEAKVMLRN